jgi:hypothetical protein
MLKDGRRYARPPLRAIVNCRTDKLQFKSMSVHVSQTGMLLETSGGLDVGQEAELQFELPDITGQLNPRAAVVRKEQETDSRTKCGPPYGVLHITVTTAL